MNEPTLPPRLHRRNLGLAMAALAAADAGMARMIARRGRPTLRPPSRPDPFAALSRAIVYQQLSGHAARRIFARLCELFAAARPEPGALDTISDAQLRAAGLSAAKSRALRELARRYLAGELPAGARLRKLPDAALVESFTQVRGIGRWTVEMLLIFELGRADVLPVSDLGVRRGYQQLYGTARLPPPAALLAHAERWRPWRSLASWYLWRAAESA